MDIHTLTDGQLQFLSAIMGGIVAISGGLLLEYYKNRNKEKIDKENEKQDAPEKIAQAASVNVQTAQNIVEMLNERMAQERKYFLEEINRCKDDCNRKLTEMQKTIDSLAETIKNMEIKK